MAKKREAIPLVEPTEPKNFRLRHSVVELVESFKQRHPLRPTMTQIVEAALLEYVQKHESELPSR